LKLLLSQAHRSKEIVSRYLWDLLQMRILLKGKEMKSMIAKFRRQTLPLRFRKQTRTKSNYLKFLNSKKMKNLLLRKDLNQLRLLNQNKKMKRSNLNQRRDSERTMTSSQKNQLLQCQLKRKLLKRKGRNSLEMLKKWLAETTS